MSTAHTPRWAGPLLGSGVVAGAMVALHALGGGVLAAPPTTSGQGFMEWVRSTEATTVGMVTLRLLALGVGYHLIATTALGVIGRLLRRPGLIRLAEWSTLPPFRSTVRRIAGIGLSASAVILTPLQGAGASTSGPGAHQPSASVPLRSPSRATATWRGPTAGPSTATLRLVDRQPGGASDGQATLRPVKPDGPEPDAPQPDAARPEAPSSPQPDATSPEPFAGPERHTVVPGDHLWSIAEARLATSLDRSPTDAEIDPYWRAVVAANTQLTDPDLLWPGSVVDVPAPPL